MSAEKHTQTPWRLWNGYGPLANGQYGVERIGPDTGGLFGYGHDIFGTKEELEYVVQSINSYALLLEAAKAALEWVRGEADRMPLDDQMKLRDAIAAAEGR